jgi:hypothetical protein
MRQTQFKNPKSGPSDVIRPEQLEQLDDMRFTIEFVSLLRDPYELSLKTCLQSIDLRNESAKEENRESNILNKVFISKRAKVLEEIIDTERTYVDRLQQLVEV